MQDPGKRVDTVDVSFRPVRSSWCPPARAVKASALLLVVCLSFMPASLKILLHTRGPAHVWGHVYAFAGLFAIWTRRTEEEPPRRWVAACVLLVLAWVIELLQARGQLALVEVGDVAADLFGVTAGWGVAALRSARASSEVKVPTGAPHVHRSQV